MVVPANASLVYSALIVVDLQQGTARSPFVMPADVVAERAGELATAFRDRGLPVVIATFELDRDDEPAFFGEPLSTLAVRADDLRVARPGWSAFAGTDLDAQLRARGVTGLVLAGVATSIGVESTARAAHDLGYELVVASDAVTDLRAETHENSLERVFPLIAKVATTRAITDLRDRR